MGITITRWKRSSQFPGITLMGALMALSGCAHMAPATAPAPVVAAPTAAPTQPKTLNEVLTQDIGAANKPVTPKDTPSTARSDTATPVSTASNPTEIIVQGVKLKNIRFDLPITVNSRVEYWIDYFSRGKGRPHFERYLERSQFFIPYIQPLLKQNKLPEDLVYLAMIESGFNNLARSRARAVGPWQFISATGKRYGLMVNWWVDERRDIRKSTLAAVEYLRDLYNMFQSWELAAAAYNAGEAKVARAIQHFGTKDFWVIARHRFLRQETRDYVPKIIAAALIAKNRELFGFQNSQPLPGPGEAVAGDGEVVKVVKTDKPEEKLNNDDEDTVAAIDDSADDPDDDDDATSPKITPATLTVPMENSLPEGQVVNNAEAQPQQLARPAPTPNVSKSGEVSGEQLAEFEVQSPADLLKVARAAGLSYQTVKSLNPELLRWCTPPTVGSYRLKLPSSTKERFLATYNHQTFPRQVQFMAYKVRKGETLQHIAQHFGIKVDPISDLNGLSSKMRLQNGARVLLPLPNDRSRSLASLDVRDPPERRRHRRHRRRYYRISYKRRESARSAGSRDDGNT